MSRAMLRPYEYMIDLMLLEEFHASTAFREWFVTHIQGFPPDAVFREAWHSVQWGKGESDLEAAFDGTSSGVTIVMLEDKIDAPLQKNQLERYRMRGDDRLKAGDCNRYLVLLVAPKTYIDQLSDKTRKLLDGAVSLEMLRQWFLAQSELGERGEFKARVLQLATEKQPRIRAGAPKGETDQGVTAFFREYSKQLRSHAPELSMHPPGPRSAAMPWISFTGIRKGVMLVHKLDHGRVELILEGHASRLEDLETRFGEGLPGGTHWQERKSQALVGLDVPQVNPGEEFTIHADAVAHGIEAVRALYAWYNTYLAEAAEDELFGQREA